ncbi:MULTISPECIES: hypothetical protein [Vibrio]|uniref:Uncharacterized protein n=3 Tax=Vibrio TaxID=662 RepID=A0A7Z1MHS7_9VIBR|nr:MULTISPECIES: hypothetical protein [Vibrio]OQQ07346.1 hypothetical protein BK411_13425 [Vibrio splendidus]KAA8675656.1 hypothetical protein F4W18_13620 [Vibrio gigantis]PMM78732.1 hypothetical protein BCT48_00230 [Vibrio sp. 10N.261.46.F12]PMP24555.1 hypothetical protein BCS91_13680 [Vibrio cyclitrophicus]PMP28148.1 hypothetical protein BCS90_20105 [Vibrio cyclitrophicus]
MNNKDRGKFKGDEKSRKEEIGSNACLFIVSFTFFIVIITYQLIKGEISFLEVAGICAASLIFISVVTHTSPIYRIKEFGEMYKIGFRYLIFLANNKR